MLIAADHLLPHISSNPLITRPPGDGGERPKALLTYMESLTRTRAMDLDVLLPGHGEPFTGHAELIDKRFALHVRRAEKLHGLIVERPRTAYELAQALWGNIAVTQAFLTLSEVLGHTDLLERDGRVRSAEEDGVTRFLPA
jgi:glyoxylase-like metal-dependent hydrolase (beta-lactamase superfamily II)